MVKIELLYTSDGYDCETCGGSYAEGLEVIVNGILVAGEPALASCFGSNSYPDLVEILTKALTHLGIENSIEEIHHAPEST